MALAWVLLLLQVDPVPTWFYVFVWYPTLILLDAVAGRLIGEGPVLRRSRLVISLLGWSAVIWLLFELANFRLRNWYYVFLPHVRVERWAGIVLSFATVVPAILLTARLLDSLGIGRNWRSRSIAARPWEFHAATALGLTATALALAVPHLFFPLIWGAVWLLLEPYVYRRHPEWSLLHDITRGEWGRVGRLMMGGLLVGLLWEFYNFWARGKWIYTVPWLEQTKLFEMPPLGFLGFPFFALEAWILYHTLCVLGVAVPIRGGRVPSPRRLVAAACGGAIFAAATLAGMERWTVSSTVPRVGEIPGVTESHITRAARAGIDSPFTLARMTPDSLAQHAEIALDDARLMVEAARLTTLRGIGSRHAAVLRTTGINTVCGLARQEPASLWRALADSRAAVRATQTVRPPPRPTKAEVRVWVGAARRNCSGADG
ncbi:MAG: DUF4332 domain-containing protein [Gemmatimonadales bacterium]|nr:DUF4332 domain-containing protein [Gemmatimonadales bacterium]NIN13350.1 DUF4332 domain-containing protein [Gemmatimonadales bacterium]NIN51353.1 DUF4332 domain-containing protein [Gemmatimonadales bacterium]NIP08817.1 DUF4332 domain-containing protein [Gemmatimonadales bacterium]NIQ99811.1 DUF4332 domain-containing protein [Gemmatimonadales bacterium]